MQISKYDKICILANCTFLLIKNKFLVYLAVSINLKTSHAIFPWLNFAQKVDRQIDRRLQLFISDCFLPAQSFLISLSISLRGIGSSGGQGKGEIGREGLETLLQGVKKAVGFPSPKVKKRKPELGTGFKRMKRLTDKEPDVRSTRFNKF